MSLIVKTQYTGAERRDLKVIEMKKLVSLHEFASVKILSDDHTQLKRLSFEYDLHNYEVIRMALALVLKLELSDQDANHPLFQSSAR